MRRTAYALIDHFGVCGGENSRVGGKNLILTREKSGSETGKVVEKCQLRRGKQVFPRTRGVKKPTSIRGRDLRILLLTKKRSQMGIRAALRSQARGKKGRSAGQNESRSSLNEESESYLYIHNQDH